MNKDARIRFAIRVVSFCRAWKSFDSFGDTDDMFFAYWCNKRPLRVNSIYWTKQWLANPEYIVSEPTASLRAFIEDNS